ncbi:CpaF/VirB11 family protein [Insolitispirillum peregrinum]|uniref:Pilus assembly protein CpaF n=1 Tax=Insolitispirillum peregrinum TaxID=80876 RepID=A0A1N7MGR5_9PROT|nr:CpaF/VirB11 family protein [Insolitispirillum peregrinum]SIS85344.1 pilus assembly protein CpaF [Insolitispirillum peregrinum]
MGHIPSSSAVLDTVLRPLARFYDDPQTVEMRMCRPGAVIVERRGHGKQQIEAAELTLAVIEDICRTLANINSVNYSPDSAPKLSCILPGLPDGSQRHRFECLTGASVQSRLSLAIRCKHRFTPTWQQVGATPQVEAFLRRCIEAEANMLISGATNTGKTTLLNKLLEFLPADRRVIAAEDTPELDIARFWDAVGLLAARDDDGQRAGMVSWRQMYDHLMRATPDHVLFGEISTMNAYPALGALNSGITGFMCTIHAASPEQALTRKFDQNIAWSGQSMPRVPEFLAELIDVVIQIKRTHDGMRRITDIYLPRTASWVMRDGVMTDLTVSGEEKHE